MQSATEPQSAQVNSSEIMKAIGTLRRAGVELDPATLESAEARYNELSAIEEQRFREMIERANDVQRAFWKGKPVRVASKRRSSDPYAHLTEEQLVELIF